MKNTEVRLERVQAIRYRMPFKKPFATSRRVNERTISFVLRVVAKTRRGEVIGVGESQPRRSLAGDLGPKRAWSYFQRAAETLPGKVIDLTSDRAVRESIAEALKDADRIAAERSTAENRAKPFRGSRSGLEMALLDLAGQLRREPVAAVLGGVQRKRVTATSYTLSAHNSAEELRRKVGIWHSRVEAIRVKATSDAEQTMELMQMIHAACCAAGGERAIWVDFNESLSPEQAEGLVGRLGHEIHRKNLPGLLTLEQPVPGQESEALPVLQRAADAAAGGIGEIRIMADESLWDTADLEKLHQGGGCRAINIKVAKAGGLLPSVEMARRAVELNPDVKIYIGGMLGSSDLTVWSLHHLAKAFPRLDYFTSTPPHNLEERIAEPVVKVKRGTLQQRNTRRPGLGAALNFQRLEPYIQNQAWFPANSAAIPER